MWKRVPENLKIYANVSDYLGDNVFVDVIDLGWKLHIARKTRIAFLFQIHFFDSRWWHQQQLPRSPSPHDYQVSKAPTTDA
jgi:hypothetical protein